MVCMHVCIPIHDKRETIIMSLLFRKRRMFAFGCWRFWLCCYIYLLLLLGMWHSATTTTTNAFVMKTAAKTHTPCLANTATKTTTTQRHLPFQQGLQKQEQDGDEYYDAIVIGSGMGSLVAGNALLLENQQKKNQNRQKRVLMLEQHSVPGGYTTNFYRHGFRFEVSTHLLTGCDGSGTIGRILQQLQVADRIHFVPLHELLRWKDPGRNIDCVVPLSLQQHIEQMVQLFPDQEEGIRTYYGIYYPVMEFVLQFQQKKGLDQVLYTLRHIPQLIHLLQLRNKTAADILDPYITDPACRDMLNTMTYIFGLHYTELDAAIAIFGSLGPFAEGACYPQGGSGKLSKVLAGRFVELGGDLRLKTTVERVLVKNRCVTGVRFKDKRGHVKTVHSPCVIAGCDINELVASLCPPGTLPESYSRDILKREPGPSVVLVWAGLDLDLRKDYNITSFEIVQNNPDLPNSQELMETVAHTADFSRLPFASATIYSNVDPNCCPPGKSIVLSLFPAASAPFERTLGPNGERGAEYKQLKQRIGKQFLENMSRVLGVAELAEHAQVVEVATPITLKRYTGHREGSFMGWKLNSAQGAFSKVPRQPPVEGLFTCGQWKSFGGVANAMTSGVEVARLAEHFLKRNPVHLNRCGVAGPAVGAPEKNLMAEV